MEYLDGRVEDVLDRPLPVLVTGAGRRFRVGSPVETRHHTAQRLETLLDNRLVGIETRNQQNERNMSRPFRPSS